MSAEIQRGQEHIRLLWKIRESLDRAARHRFDDVSARIAQAFGPGTNPDDGMLKDHIVDFALELDCTIEFKLKPSVKP